MEEREREREREMEEMGNLLKRHPEKQRQRL